VVISVLLLLAGLLFVGWLSYRAGYIRGYAAKKSGSAEVSWR
jgi:hypothetical protein